MSLLHTLSNDADGAYAAYRQYSLLRRLSAIRRQAVIYYRRSEYLINRCHNLMAVVGCCPRNAGFEALRDLPLSMIRYYACSYADASAT